MTSDDLSPRTDLWLIAGLGNAGPWFAGTRHNAGFSVVEHLAARAGARFRWAGPRCRVAQVELAGCPVLLAKPLWNINKSGGPVAALMRARQVPALRLVVVQDDLDFPFGSVWLKRGGGPGGHNGVRSVSDTLNSREYARLRFGVGRPAKGEKVGRFVLGKFAEAEREQMPALLDRCAEAVDLLIAQGLDRAQTVLHTAQR
ncbi:aminoacyl-tRNA hydrolase [Catenulispora rubra]|uniref:aminoacyl-tRNA hydrolase n=1 Tax=Catenulispora rubra TaxID=280293 RepID=UPI002B265760|nr:aminoacyl-tRNA hydrolase [Catenulispora rubra]